MSGNGPAASVSDALAQLETAMDGLAAADLDSCTDAEIEDVWRRLEAVRRRSSSFEHQVIYQVTTRSMPFERGMKTPVQYASQLLRISAGDAASRVRAAKDLGPRPSLTGPALAPIYPLLAQALADGQISTTHAQVVTKMVDKLPDEISAEVSEALEAELLDYAKTFPPDHLAKIAERIRIHLDQDGSYRDPAEQQRRRRLELHRRADGSGHLEAELTPECAEHLETQLDALARPEPEKEGQPDLRTPAQRRHDALLAILTLVEKAKLLPKTSGVTTTILLHMDADTYATSHGFATTGHGYAIPAEQAKKWAGDGPGDEARIIAVLLSKAKRIEAFSDTHRIFTQRQRLAMLVRDRGCTFPSCDSTALFTEAHHVHEFHTGGKTSTDNGTLLCAHHHAHFQTIGWHCTTINNTTWWTPPTWTDPTQTPRRNTMHDRPCPGTSRHRRGVVPQ